MMKEPKSLEELQSSFERDVKEACSHVVGSTFDPETCEIIRNATLETMHSYYERFPHWAPEKPEFDVKITLGKEGDLEVDWIAKNQAAVEFFSHWGVDLTTPEDE